MYFFLTQINMIKFMEEIFGEKVPETEHVIVYTPSYFEKLDALLKDVNTRDLLDYMRWQVIKPLLKELNQAVIEMLLQYQKVSQGKFLMIV